MSEDRMLAATPENLKALRVRHGLTQTQAARLMRLSEGVRVSQYERGFREVDPLRWELLLIELGEHPDYMARPMVEA